MKAKKFNPTDTYKVESSHLTEVSYDRISQIMQIQFTSGEVYQYFDIRPVTNSLMKEQVKDKKSIGEFFDQHIRCNYKYKQVKGIPHKKKDCKTKTK